MKSSTTIAELGVMPADSSGAERVFFFEDLTLEVDFMSSFVPCYVNPLCAISLRLCAHFSLHLMLCVADNEVFVSAPRVV